MHGRREREIHLTFYQIITQQQHPRNLEPFSCVHRFFLLLLLFEDIEWKVLILNIEKSMNLNQRLLREKKNATTKSKRSLESKKECECEYGRNQKSIPNRMRKVHRIKAFPLERKEKIYLQIGSISGRYNTTDCICELNWWNRVQVCARLLAWVCACVL